MDEVCLLVRGHRLDCGVPQGSILSPTLFNLYDQSRWYPVLYFRFPNNHGPIVFLTVFWHLAWKSEMQASFRNTTHKWTRYGTFFSLLFVKPFTPCLLRGTFYNLRYVNPFKFRITDRYDDLSLLTMLASMICPFPDFVRSSKAKTMPRAHVSPPPAKSAKRFSGAYGFSPLRPRQDKSPASSNGSDNSMRQLARAQAHWFWSSFRIGLILPVHKHSPQTICSLNKLANWITFRTCLLTWHGQVVDVMSGRCGIHSALSVSRKACVH